MIRLLAAAGLVVMFSAGAFAQDAKKVEEGEKLYAAQKCQMCHSIGGKGNAKGPLDAVGSKLTAEELRLWLVEPKQMTEKTKSTRKPAMPSYAKLTQEQVDALVAYMQTLKKQ